MKVTATPTAAPGSRLIQSIRQELLSSHTIARLRQELEDELDAVSSSHRAVEEDARRDALERAVRRIWGAPL